METVSVELQVDVWSIVQKKVEKNALVTKQRE